MPTEENNILRFENYQNKLKVPFCIYADIESILLPADEANTPFCSSENTKSYQQHEAFCIGFYFQCSYDSSLSFYRHYRGKDCMKWFCLELYAIYEQVRAIFEYVMPMNLSAEEEHAFQDAEYCHICSKSFSLTHYEGEQKVRDHSHLSGAYRGAAHAKCNIRFQESRKIPVIFHNLSGYDSHFLIRELAHTFEGDIDIIPNNDQNYIAFIKTVADSMKGCAGFKHRMRNKIQFKFIDSFRFLGAALDKLAAYLPSECKSILRKEFGEIGVERVQLLERKGVFPYDFLDSWTKMEYNALPPKDAFYSNLTESAVSDDDYQHAQTVWNAFNIQNLGEYAMLYLKTDILLLCDVFEHFRSTMSSLFDLDPACYYTLPGYSFDAMLKYTGVRIELLTDIDMPRRTRHSRWHNTMLKTLCSGQ